MKVRIKTPFYDGDGLHKSGEVIDVKKFDPALMEIVAEKKAKIETAVAKTPTKTTRKKD